MALGEDGKVKEQFTVHRRNMKGRKGGRTVILNAYGRRGITPWLVQLKEMDVIHKVICCSKVWVELTKLLAGFMRGGRVLTKAYRAAGLKGKLGAHAMRKTFANNVYTDFLRRVANGEPLDAFRAVAKSLGHKDINSTDKYLSFLTEDIDKTIMSVGV